MLHNKHTNAPKWASKHLSTPRKTTSSALTATNLTRALQASNNNIASLRIDIVQHLKYNKKVFKYKFIKIIIEL